MIRHAGLRLRYLEPMKPGACALQNPYTIRPWRWGPCQGRCLLVFILLELRNIILRHGSFPYGQYYLICNYMYHQPFWMKIWGLSKMLTLSFSPGKKYFGLPGCVEVRPLARCWPVINTASPQFTLLRTKCPLILQYIPPSVIHLYMSTSSNAVLGNSLTSTCPKTSHRLPNDYVVCWKFWKKMWKVAFTSSDI